MSLTDTFLMLNPTLSPDRSLSEGLVVHLYGFHLSGDVGGSEGDDHAGLEDSSLHTTHRDRSNASNFVDVLEGHTQRLTGGSLGGEDGVKGFEQGGSGQPL